MLKYPNISINMKKFRHNAFNIKKLCEKYNVDVYPVVKGISGDRKLIEELVDIGYKIIADSRMVNIMKYKDLPIETLLLRIPMQSMVDEVIQYVDISLNSELQTIILLNKEAKHYNKLHKIILMIELGDLREGILPDDVEDMVSEILKLENIILYGIGVNLTCFGAIIPDEQNLGKLCAIAEQIENQFSIKLEVISGGNSSSIPLLLNQKLPEKINILRLGEALLLGTEAVNGELIEGQYTDVFTIEAELVEVKLKNSIPTGQTGVDAFGQPFVMPKNKGIHLRGIVALGRQDMDLESIKPIDKRITIIGASSDHCLLDLQETNGDYNVGDIVRFQIKYVSLMRAMTSSYILKHYIY